ncbi:MAG: hypothetical protein KGD68_00725 [Candidatus Lokiarchaeota archaeon]|nr:hypothetical protein [Candidatus Lokiarchaeota archaeon]
MTQLIKCIIAVGVGFFMLLVAPILVQISLEALLGELLIIVVTQPQFSSGITLFSLFYPLWRAIGYIAGIVLLAMVPSIYKGKEWTMKVELTAYAVPAVSGMFMFLPYISFVGGFPIPMIISFVGLLGFWSVFLFQKYDSVLEKIVNIITYTFIGMLTTHAFVIGVGAQRMLLTRAAAPLFDGLEWWILTLSGEVNWMAVLMLFASIPLMAERKKNGWWIALVAALTIVTINIPTQIIRTRTLDYLIGAILAAGLLALLLIFKDRLIDENQTNLRE